MACTRGCCPTNREHWMSVGVAPSALPTRGGARVSDTNRRERELVGDLAAYKALRHDGLQPQGITGAKQLTNRAECEEHVETAQMARTAAGDVVNTNGMLRVKASSFDKFTDDYGVKATTPQTTPIEPS